MASLVTQTTQTPPVGATDSVSVSRHKQRGTHSEKLSDDATGASPSQTMSDITDESHTFTTAAAVAAVTQAAAAVPVTAALQRQQQQQLSQELQHAPLLSSTRHAPFSKTTDCVLPSPHAPVMSPSQQQLFSDIEAATAEVMTQDFYRALRTGTCQSPASCVQTGASGSSVITSSIDEGVEVDLSEQELELCSNSSAGSHSSQPLGDSFGMQAHSDAISCAPATSTSFLTSDWWQLQLQMQQQVPSNAVTSNTSSQSLNTTLSSPFTSFDSNIEADLFSSGSSSLHQQHHTPPPHTAPHTDGSPPLSGLTNSPRLTNATQHFHQMSTPSHATNRAYVTMTPPPVRSKCRCVTPSPAGGYTHHASPDTTQYSGAGDGGDSSGGSCGSSGFGINRRASDGFVAAAGQQQASIAFKQRIRHGMKTRGVAEIRKEMATLVTQYPHSLTEHERQSLQTQHKFFKDETDSQLRQRSLDENSKSATSNVANFTLRAKRISLPSPAQFELMSNRMLRQLTVEGAAGRCGKDDGISVNSKHTGSSMPYSIKSCEFPSQKSLQQQLLHHRLQQKRQLFQKHGHTLSGPPTSVLTGQSPAAHLNQQMLRQFQQLQLDATSQLPQQLDCAGAVVPHFPVAHSPPLTNNSSVVTSPQKPPRVTSSSAVLPPHPTHHLIRQSSYKMAQQQPILPSCTPLALAPTTSTPTDDSLHLLWQHAPPAGDSLSLCKTTSAVAPLSPMLEEGPEDDVGGMDVEQTQMRSFRFAEFL